MNTIRPAVRSDASAVAALWRAFMDEQAALDATVTPATDADARWAVTFRDLVDDDAAALLVVEDDNGRIVGFAVAEPHAEAPVYAPVPEVYVGELYVAPEARRHGVARALLDAVAAWAAGQGAARLRFSVLWANAPSRRMVEAWGASPQAVTYVRALQP